MPLHADATMWFASRGSTVTAKTSESSIIPFLIRRQFFPLSVDLYARHHVPAYIVLVFRGSVASESILTGMVVDEIFSQSSPEFLDIHTPLRVPARITSGSLSDWVIAWIDSPRSSFASFHL